MKKFVCLVLSVLLSISVFAPITVFAASDESVGDSVENDLVEVMKNLELIAVIDTDKATESEEIFDDMSIVYCNSTVAASGVSTGYKNMSYNKKNNTLTLNKVNNKNLSLVVVNMGENFKIKLNGYNELYAIESASYGKNASVTLTGNGELVLKRNADYEYGIYIGAGGTPSFFHAEKDVNLKIYSSYDEYIEEYSPAILVSYSTILDANKLIKLDGKFSKKPKIKKESYTEHYYEQVEAYDYDSCHYELSDAVFTKSGDDTTYIGFEDYDSETYAANGKYYIIPVIKDEVLDCYSSKGVVDFEKLNAIDPTKNGYTMVMNGKKPKKLKNIFIADEKVPYNLAIADDGTKYGFDEYGYGEEAGYFMYDLIEHPTFGLIAKENDDKDDLSGLKVNETGSQTFMSAYIEKTLTMNNGGSTIPATVKLSSAKNDASGVKVTWNKVSNATSYKVYRKTSNEKSWTALGTATGTSYIDKTAKSGAKYSYTVRAGNIRGWGGYDKKGVSVTYLAAPKTTLTATTSGVNVKWSKIGGAKQYKIYRKADGDKNWTTLTTTSNLSYTDKTSKNNKNYTYAVRALNGKNTSAYVSVKTKYFTAPKISSVKNTASGVKVDWAKVSGAGGYKIYRKTGSNGWEYLGKTSSSVLTFTDSTAKSGKTYSYTVRAYSGSINGAYNKNGVSVKYLATPKVSTKNNASSVSLSWKTVGGAKEYAIYRKANGEKNWTKLTTTTKLSYTDKKVTSGKTYSYAVKAVNSKVTSSYKTAKITFLSQPKITSTKVNDTNVTVSWKKVSGADSYRVYRKTSGSEKWVALGDVKSTSFVDKTAADGNLYAYTVKAIKGSYYSAYDKNGVAVSIPKVVPQSYVLNTETLKIHQLGCWHINKIAEENKQEYTGDIKDLIEKGYTTCGTCF